MEIEITDQYLKTAKIRRKKLQATCRARYDRAWDVARQAAGLLKETYHVSRVVVFGSLVASDQFHLRSDIDLAVWGIDDRDYYQAVGVLQSLDREIAIDVIIYDEAKEYLQRAIDREGISI
jgi:predicted nucleotidyltransferase